MHSPDIPPGHKLFTYLDRPCLGVSACHRIRRHGRCMIRQAPLRPSPQKQIFNDIMVFQKKTSSGNQGVN